MKIDFNKSQIQDLIEILNREINSNISLADNVKGFEKRLWLNEIFRFKEMKEKLSRDLQIVIQGLTSEQEDIMIENQLETIRERKENDR